MVAACYLNIAPEDTPIDFIILKLKENAVIKHILRNILRNKPDKILQYTKVFESRLILYQPPQNYSSVLPTTQYFTG